MGDHVGTVSQLWRFPVKSMQGFTVDELTFGADRVEGDRMWAVVDPAAGKVLSAKRWGQLLLARSGIDEATGAVTVTLPDGTTHAAGDPAANEALSAWLDHEVRLQPPPPGEGLPYEIPTEAWDDQSPTWEFPGPPGGPFVDLAAAHLLTTASLRAAQQLHPDGDWNIRRFRPTAVLDVDGDDFVEDAWVGQHVTLGDADTGVQVDPFMPTVRCAMITREQPGLAKDADIARSLNQAHGLNLGVYCAIGRPGTVHVGDQVFTAA